MRKAPPKPAAPPCPFCDRAYWRYNGTSWWACDRDTRRKHICDTPGAVEQRVALEVQREAERKRRAAHQRRADRTPQIFKAIAMAAIAILIGYWIYNDSTAANAPTRPSNFSPSGANFAPFDSPTAKCADGTYSYSAHHQGTCSWHGGVVTWYR